MKVVICADFARKRLEVVLVPSPEPFFPWADSDKWNKHAFGREICGLQRTEDLREIVAIRLHIFALIIANVTLGHNAVPWKETRDVSRGSVNDPGRFFDDFVRYEKIFLFNFQL